LALHSSMMASGCPRHADLMPAYLSSCVCYNNGHLSSATIWKSCPNVNHCLTAVNGIANNLSQPHADDPDSSTPVLDGKECILCVE